MTRDELIDARDVVENIAGSIYNITSVEDEAFEQVVNKINELLGCEDCNDLGWIMKQSEDEENNIIIYACQNCNRYTDDVAAREFAYVTFKKVYEDLCDKISIE
jgi:hypothetical protein